MKTYHLSLAADLDIQIILDYIAQRGSSYAADRFAERLKSRFRKLAATPELGRRRDELSFGLRSYAEGNYIIFYRDMGEYLRIDRVIHGARDYEWFF